MQKRSFDMGGWFAKLIIFGCLCAVSCCTFDPTVVGGRSDTYYSCGAKLNTYRKVNAPLDLTATRLTVNPPMDYKGVQGLLKDKSKTYKPYLDRPWVIRDTDFPEIRGACLVSTYFADRGVTGPNQLRLKWHNASSRLFVCYDSRAARMPDWLTRSYERMTRGNGTPYYVTITMPDKSKSKPYPNVKMEIWRYKDKESFASGDEVSIQGNLSGYAQWPAGFPPGEKAMYFVLVKPEVQLKSGPQLIYVNLAVGCYPTEADAVKAARERCEEERKKLKVSYDAITCGEPGCTTMARLCPPSSSTAGLTINRSFLHRSEIEFLSSRSTLTVEVEGRQETRPVKGSLHFEYLPATHDIRINSMVLNLDDFHMSGVGDMEDITAVLLDASTAHCSDTYPSVPCDGYRISPNEFVCANGVTVDGDALLFVSKNAQAVDVTIDQTAKTFQIKGGPLSGTIQVNGENLAVRIWIDLLGRFLNFAPKAVGSESEQGAECSEGTNQSPIHLYASGSYDIYDSIPANNYEWYEDLGLMTEKLWGTGTEVTIGKGQLAYGIHRISLLVRDTYGMVDVDTIELDVQDTTPPTLNVPQDVYRIVSPPQTVPVQLDIGQASASDACSSEVLVTNDAPDPPLFGEGVTNVLWEADDGRGNVASAVQKVYVFLLSNPSECRVKDLLSQLEDSVGYSTYKVQQCGTGQNCHVDLHSLAAAVNTLAQGLREHGLRSQELTQELVEGLQEVASDLDNAHALLQTGETDSAGIRSGSDAVAQYLSSAAEELRTLQGRVGRSSLPDGIWKDVPPGSGTGAMNFYVQTYSAGSCLIIASPDGRTAWAFLDSDLSDGFDAMDLGGLGNHLTVSFTGSDQGNAVLVREDGSRHDYPMYRWFPASPSDRFGGIYKDAEAGNPVGMNFFVQTYDNSMIVITTPDARSFHVFLAPVKREPSQVTAMDQEAVLSAVFTEMRQSVSITTSDGSRRDFNLHSWYSPSSRAAISGRITDDSGAPLAGVTVDFGDLGSVVTDASGNYRVELAACSGWTGTAVPSLSGYTFDPPSRSYTGVTSDRTDQDFTGTSGGGEPESVRISGTVSIAGDPLSGVTLDFGEQGTVVTDGSGQYSKEVPFGWSGTVTPFLEGYTFEPPSRSYSNVTEDQPDQDYAAVWGS